MTEDDTYRVLTQLPFRKVKKLIYNNIHKLDTIEDAEIFLLKYGWTVDEYDRVLENDRR